ncbi:MAG: metal ABC transporter permease [Roseiflexaceae bacterium]|nr:metal ABC transporter permease [Roseiflexaceae bacterium]
MIETLWNWFVEPFQYSFMQTALGVSAFVGVVCALLSCYLILKGWSLMGDALSHAVLPGVVVAYLLGLPFALGAFASGLASAILIGWVKRNARIKEDTVIGLVFTAFFALGLILLSRTVSDVHLSHILYGNVLGIEPEDLIQTLIAGSIALGAVAILRRDLMLFCFDPNHARAIGLNTTFLYYALLTLLALTVVAALQAVGIILVIAMLITPGAIGYLLTDRFDHMMGLAVGAAVLASILGVYMSFHLDASTGGCIVVMQALLFFAAMLFAPKRGLLARFWLRRTMREAQRVLVPSKQG